MTIHHSDPFATPAHLRSPARRLRGRLPAAVTLWTSRHPDTGIDAGLTVSSTLIVDGEPGRVLGVLGDESDLWATIEAAGLFTVTPLTAVDRRLADRFAGLLPSPGGLFRDGDWVTVPAGRLPSERPESERPSERSVAADQGSGDSAAAGRVSRGSVVPGLAVSEMTVAGLVPAHLTTWLVCRLDDARTVGWGLLIESTIVQFGLGEPAAEPLVHQRGRYFTIT